MAQKAKAKKTTTRKKGVKNPKVPKTAAGDIGIDVRKPAQTCEDDFCPFHGELAVRGQMLEGMVVSDRMQRTVVVKKEYFRKIEKYERFEKRSSKYLAHSPPCLGAKTGDHVKIMECRPLSKKVSYVIIENNRQEGGE